VPSSGSLNLAPPFFGSLESPASSVNMAKYPDFEPLKELFQHHIDSYNHLIESGLETTLSGIKPIEVRDTFTNKKLRNILVVLYFNSIQLLHFLLNFCKCSKHF